jgi:hypothetical protein
LEATIGSLSDLLVRNYSVSFITQFWQSLAGATIVGPFEQELSRRRPSSEDEHFRIGGKKVAGP